MADRVRGEENAEPTLPDSAGDEAADYSLLLHEYGLTEVEAPRREGTPYQHFKLVDMRGKASYIQRGIFAKLIAFRSASKFCGAKSGVS
jgi:hypothetical protein